MDGILTKILLIVAAVVLFVVVIVGTIKPSIENKGTSIKTQIDGASLTD